MAAAEYVSLPVSYPHTQGPMTAFGEIGVVFTPMTFCLIAIVVLIFTHTRFHLVLYVNPEIWYIKGMARQLRHNREGNGYHVISRGFQYRNIRVMGQGDKNEMS